jgi:hypothetical protein
VRTFVLVILSFPLEFSLHCVRRSSVFCDRCLPVILQIVFVDVSLFLTFDFIFCSDVEVLVCDELNSLLSSAPKSFDTITEDPSLISKYHQSYLAHSNHSSVVAASLAEMLSARMKASGTSEFKVLSLESGDASLEVQLLSKLASVESTTKVKLVCSNSGSEAVSIAAKNLSDCVSTLGKSSQFTVASVANGIEEGPWDLILVPRGLDRCHAGKVGDYAKKLLKNTKSSGSQVIIVQAGAESVQNKFDVKFSEEFFGKRLHLLAAESVISELASSLDESEFVRSKVVSTSVDVTHALLTKNSSSEDLLSWFFHSNAAQMDHKRLAMALHFIRENASCSDNRASVVEPLHLITVTRL